MERVDCIVIGAGVIGLAIARELARAGKEVLILEAAEAIGTQTSSRNSEVIHAGIYYPPGSLMARFCVAGRNLLYAYCAAHGIPHRRCGKLIVATTHEEQQRLGAIANRAAANGVTDLEQMTEIEARRLEPDLNCVAALHSPSTGIIDSHAYMLALRGEAEDAGGMVALLSPVLEARATDEGFELAVGGREPMTLGCRLLVNAAGLQAPDIARTIPQLSREIIPRAHYAKGNYFILSCRAPFSRLIYPVPVAGGLGVHLTLDLAGRARFGPDIEWIEAIDYSVDPGRAERFYDAVRRYWPGLPDGSLQPGYAGVRPKIVPPEVAVQDFVVQGPQTHGVPGLVNLFGIESPGLTASLALAVAVRELLLSS